jgi:hypothetical protein
MSLNKFKMSSLADKQAKVIAEETPIKAEKSKSKKPKKVIKLKAKREK